MPLDVTTVKKTNAAQTNSDVIQTTPNDKNSTKKNKLPRLSSTNQARAAAGYVLGEVANAFDSNSATLILRIGTVGVLRFCFGNKPQDYLKFAAYDRAIKKCPAYKEYVAEYFSKHPPKDKNNIKWEEIPTTNGDYIKKYQARDRSMLFFDGKIPKQGIEFTSSGTTGKPKIFTVSLDEIERTSILLNTSIERELVGNRHICNTFIPNSVSAMMVDKLTKTCVITPIHDDEPAVKEWMESQLSPASILQNTKKDSKFNIILTGYPSVVNRILEDDKVREAITKVDKSKVKLSVISGGEKSDIIQKNHMIELGVDYIISSYGASDVGIGLGGQDKKRELAIERACNTNRKFCRELFGQDYPPSIFYYDPGTYVIDLVKDNEEDKMGELFFTVLKSDKAMAVMKYSMGDIGCFYKPEYVNEVAKKHGITLPNTHPLPLLALNGRIRDSVAYEGPKFTTGQFAQAIANIKVKDKKLSDFCSNHGLNKAESSTGGISFLLELKKEYSISDLGDISNLKQNIIDNMISISKDFKWGYDIAKLNRNGNDNLSLQIFEHGKGPIFDVKAGGRKQQLVFKDEMLDTKGKPVQPVFKSN